MLTPPQKEHEWLQQLVGEWEYEHQCPGGPGQPDVKSTGTENVRSLGGHWIVGEGRGEMPGGGAATMILTLGYDPDKKRYVGTWIGSMMSHLWIYGGQLDETGRKLTLTAEGPNFADGGKTRTLYHDIITLVSPDHRMLTSEMRTPDGKWQQFMTAHYRRRKA